MRCTVVVTIYVVVSIFGSELHIAKSAGKTFNRECINQRLNSCFMKAFPTRACIQVHTAMLKDGDDKDNVNQKMNYSFTSKSRNTLKSVTICQKVISKLNKEPSLKFELQIVRI